MNNSAVAAAAASMRVSLCTASGRRPDSLPDEILTKRLQRASVASHRAATLINDRPVRPLQSTFFGQEPLHISANQQTDFRNCAKCSRE